MGACALQGKCRHPRNSRGQRKCNYYHLNSCATAIKADSILTGRTLFPGQISAILCLSWHSPAKAGISSSASPKFSPVISSWTRSFLQTSAAVNGNPEGIFTGSGFREEPHPRIDHSRPIPYVAVIIPLTYKAVFLYSLHEKGFNIRHDPIIP